MTRRTVKSLGPVVDVAIPHEAGHIVVGRAVGFLARGLDVYVERMPDGKGLIVGNFATGSYSPPDDQIPGMDPKLKAAYILFVAGGVAGNLFDGMTGPDQGAEADRKELVRFTVQSLEEVAAMAVPVIRKHRRHFRRLVSLATQRYRERVAKNRDVQTGRHSLLTQAEIEQILNAP